MILPIYELGMKALGYRKVGAFDQPDPRDWQYTPEVGERLRALHDGHGGFGDLSIYAQDQGTDPSCTAFGLAHAINIEIRKVYKYMPDVRGIDLWRKQQEHTGSDLSQGYSLQGALNCARLYNVFDHAKQKWYKIKYWRVPKEAVWQVLDRDNATLYTGSPVNWRMCDSNWNLINGSNAGGHAYTMYDGNVVTQKGKGLNSWDRWGILNTGAFNISQSNVPYMFTFYAVEVMEL